MPEYVIALKGPDGTTTETVHTRETAEGIKERWEAISPKHTAVITEPAAAAA